MSRYFLILFAAICMLLTGCESPSQSNSIDGNSSTGGKSSQKQGKEISGDSYIVKKTDKNIVIDGCLNEEVWNECDTLSGFRVVKDGVKPAQQSKMKVAYDDCAIYFGFMLEDKSSPGLHEIKNNSNIWEDDRIEIFIDPEPATSAYLQFAVNGYGRQMAGTMGNIEYENPYQDWNPKWDAKAVRKAGYWFLEVRIPFDAIECRPAFGTVWKINICRQQTLGGKPVYSAWNTKYGGFHYCGNDFIFE